MCKSGDNIDKIIKEIWRERLEWRMMLLHVLCVIYLTTLYVLVCQNIQSVPGGKVNNLGGHVSVILRKFFIWTCVLFRTVSVILRTVLWIWRAIFSFPSAVMRHCLKHVNRCEASVGCCNCCWLLLIGPVIWEDRMTGQNYQEFLKNELPEQVENVTLATRIVIPDLWFNISMTLSVIGGLVVAVPLTDHKNLQT
jgi:hypothetical protein